MNAPLSDEDIREQIHAIVAKQAKVEAASLRSDATLKDLGIESIEAIELIFDIEEHFDITFPDEGANFDTDTVQHLTDAVRGALQAKSGGSEATA